MLRSCLPLLIFPCKGYTEIVFTNQGHHCMLVKPSSYQVVEVAGVARENERLKNIEFRDPMTPNHSLIRWDRPSFCKIEISIQRLVCNMYTRGGGGTIHILGTGTCNREGYRFSRFWYKEWYQFSRFWYKERYQFSQFSQLV